MTKKKTRDGDDKDTDSSTDISTSTVAATDNSADSQGTQDIVKSIAGEAKLLKLRRPAGVSGAKTAQS